MSQNEWRAGKNIIFTAGLIVNFFSYEYLSHNVPFPLRISELMILVQCAMPCEPALSRHSGDLIRCFNSFTVAVSCEVKPPWFVKEQWKAIRKCKIVEFRGPLFLSNDHGPTCYQGMLGPSADHHPSRFLISNSNESGQEWWHFWHKIFWSVLKVCPK